MNANEVLVTRWPTAVKNEIALHHGPRGNRREAFYRFDGQEWRHIVWTPEIEAEFQAQRQLGEILDRLPQEARQRILDELTASR